VRSITLTVLALALLALAPPADGADVIAADSGATRGVALVTRTDAQAIRVLHQDAAGRWKRFPISGRPEGVRVVVLEDGGGLAAWDAGSEVLVRRWDAKGAVSAPRAVLHSISPTWYGDFDAAEWQLVADRHGTVVIASSGDRATAPGAIVATVRDPGGDFGPQQQIGQVDPEPGIGDEPSLDLSPIAPDGSVAVRWALHGYGPGNFSVADESGHAVRVGRAASFGPPQPPPGPPAGNVLGRPQPGTSALLAVQAAQSATVRVGPGVLALCRRASGGCDAPRLFRWHGTAVIAVQAMSCNPCVDFALAGSWYLARVADGGVFDHAVLATRDAGAQPVRTSRAGIVAFRTSG
jgi:hypothetical protein